jgi:hypothetical protein
MAGNAGRYISIEKGPIAVSKPNMRMRYDFLAGVLMDICYGGTKVSL